MLGVSPSHIIWPTIHMLTKVNSRVWPDIRFGLISGRIPVIETIQIPDIWLIYNARYPVIRPNPSKKTTTM